MVGNGLVLTRKEGQSIMIGDDIEVYVSRLGPGRQVRLSIRAPKNLKVDRKEIRNRTSGGSGQ